MKSFQQIQLDFVAHIKDPDENPYQGDIEDERLKIYRELFFNNVLGFISSGFPVLESLYCEQDWQQLARQFFAQHKSRSPYFIDISKEFVEFLSNEYQPTESDPIFLRELAHYEWLELDLSVRKVQQPMDFWDGQSAVSSVRMSQLASLVSYPYPVHQIAPDFQPSESQGTVYLVVYRDNTDEVNFTLVNEVTAHLLTIIQDEDKIQVQALIQSMITALPQLKPQQVIDSLQKVLQQLLSQHILLPVKD
ncbi:putative DNA-binding domain-containing protein [Paraglaciecola aquimarina]|uniref:DNA-binding domain-containing protein n=1 Tax=Paraglaciecola algarum TaxID=3050085 RepID=A0ABS9DCX1_9ALTE|nr:putative DNA-binding domain-containing protein [Paraglaciecola sp. G1-23]MCF2949852.1 putative DNA-binding domain-containing protein [Paraglaciecola sp. G1-23]